MLVTAGGKIACARCTAKSKRTGNQCGKPSLKGKAVCQFHGGQSTGPKTEIGKARQRASVITSGNYTKESIANRTRSALRLAGLEDAMEIVEARLYLWSAFQDARRSPSGAHELTGVSQCNTITFAAGLCQSNAI